MIDCVSVENMRLSDRLTIESGVSSLTLIGRAAYAVYCSVDWKVPVAIVAGSGNNGADGFALAEILHERGIDCCVYTVSQRLHSDADFYAARCAERGVPVVPYEIGCLKGYKTIVDCMLGTGFSGALKPIYKQAIEELNKSDAHVVSVDINSGMNGDSGFCEIAVRSDLTVTIGFVKRGLIVPAAGAYIGRLVCVDIGIPLAEKEDMICGEGETENCGIDGTGNYHPCPRWLDMDIKRYYADE